MTIKQYSAHEVAGPVRLEFAAKDRKGGFGRAGRVVSGLLKAAVKSGAVTKTETHGRVTGSHVWYWMTDEQVAAIRAEAVSRAA